MDSPDYFEDAPGKDAPSEKPDEGDQEQGDDQTYLVNKSAYPEAKPGDVFKMRVERVESEEMECSVIKDDEEHEDEGEPAPDEAPMPAGIGNGMMD